MIERIEVDVREELARLVADRDAATPFAGDEQVVAGEPVVNLFLRVAAVDDSADQPQHVGVLDLAGRPVLGDRVIHRREELLDVRLENVTVPAGEFLTAIDGGVRSLPLAARIGVADERPLEYRLQRAGQCVMDDAVEIWVGTDLPPLRFGDEEAATPAGPTG
jgi:hypothetical protein